MPTEDAARQKWLEDTLKRLLTFWNQRYPREISWQEAAGLINESWLKDHFGTPSTIDIGALRGALIEETPKTAGPPRPAHMPALSKRSQSQAASVPTKSHANAGRKRGPKNLKFRRVVSEMTQNIKDGVVTPESLENDLEKSLEITYGASRDICRKARNEVLSQLNSDK